MVRHPNQFREGLPGARRLPLEQGLLHLLPTAGAHPMANQSMKQHQPTSRYAEQPWADQRTLAMPCGYDSEALDAAALFEDLQPILATAANHARSALLLPPAPVGARRARGAQPPSDQRRTALLAIGICGLFALAAALAAGVCFYGV